MGEGPAKTFYSLEFCLVTFLKCWENLDWVKGWVWSLWIALFTHSPLPPAEEEKQVVDADWRALSPASAAGLATASTDSCSGLPILLSQPGEPCSMVGALLLAPKPATQAHNLTEFSQGIAVGPMETVHSFLRWSCPLDTPVSQACQNKVIKPQFLFKTALRMSQVPPELSSAALVTALCQWCSHCWWWHGYHTELVSVFCRDQIIEGFLCRILACVWPLRLPLHKEEDCDSEHSAPSTFLS